MKISLTASEILDHNISGLWMKVCDMRGINEWCINEGLMDGGEILTFTEDEAKELGILT